MSKLKLMTIIGTRPEIIRLSAVIKKCDIYFDQILVHTGQNYDYSLNQVFFDDFNVAHIGHVEYSLLKIELLNKRDGWNRDFAPGRLRRQDVLRFLKRNGMDGMVCGCSRKIANSLHTY